MSKELPRRIFYSFFARNHSFQSPVMQIMHVIVGIADVLSLEAIAVNGE